MPASSLPSSPVPVADTDTDVHTLRTPPLPRLIELSGVALAAKPMVRAGLPRLQRWLEPSSARPRPFMDATDPDLAVAQLGRWVDAVMRRGSPLIRPGCQTRGVTLYYALRRQGLDVALCFGVGTVGGAVEGHCWIDLHGEPVLERSDPRAAFLEMARVSRFGVTS
jgi:hypothetical protein